MSEFKTKIATLILALFMVVCVVSCDSSDDDDDSIMPAPTTINISSLLATTGNSSSFGESCWAAIQLAEDDINEWMVGENDQWSVNINLVDTQGSTESALAALENLANGENIVIGPTTSAEADYIREYATDNDILLVSPSSVAISIALPEDNLFRFVTNDTYQAKAMTAMLLDDTMDVIIPLSRDDVWGNDLLGATTLEFAMSGGIVLEGVKYDPATDDFASTLETFNGIVEAAIAQYPQMKIGIYALTFGEITSIFEEVANIQTLLDLDWYGSSAAAKNASLATNAVAAEVATIVGFPCSTYGDNDSPEFEALKTRLETALGREAESYAFAAYDAAWVAAKSYFELGNDSPEFADLKAKFSEISETYVGVTGPVILNDAGDRQYGNYDFWQIRADGEAFEWYKAARYEIDPDTFEGTLRRY